ncbi:MAG: beta-galactosidase, partial [Bacteroidales bacterium]|nr:beta-galactosidase [Bacteroidales bacterium]
MFVNNREAGSRNSLAVSHEYDITSLINEGSNRISIRIDNRIILPVGVNSHSVSDHTQSNWNGIIGAIKLETRNPVFIKNIQVFPDIQSKSVRVQVALHNATGNQFDGNIELQANSFNSEKTHSATTRAEQVSLAGNEHMIELEYAMGFEVLYWSEFSPALYNLEVSLTDSGGQVVDRKSETFGMREFKAEGTRFLVNGRPVFLRGTLECCIFPLTGYPPTDEASWEYVMNRCKEHGLNHIRFHSWCPPEAAFNAADKLGIYLHVECGSWANQGSSLGDGSPLDTYLYDESDRIIEAFGNHPSFCMLAYGNEPAGENMNRYLVGLMDHWRSRDRRRVYTAGAGWPLLPENDFHNGPQPRIQHWGQGLGSIIYASAPQTMYDFHDVISEYDVPFVSHEIGQWCVYPDFKEIPKYTGVLKPTNFEIFKETL